MRAAIYARVSSAGQRERHTIESQLRVLRAYVQQQGWTLAGEYIDDGRSAKTGKLKLRDGFSRLQRDAAAGAFDVLVVVDVDRLTRTDDMSERARILGPFQQADVKIVTPSGGELDLRTFLGELYVLMQSLVAAEESRKRNARVKAGKERAIAEGRKHGGPTPFGWKYSREIGQWSLHEQHAEIQREAFRRVIAGESCGAIADDFHARGLPSPRRARAWGRMAVWKIVTSRRALGEWQPQEANRGRRTIPIPAIVDLSTWQAAQAALQGVGRKLRGLVKTKHVYLMQGIGTCGVCGSPIAIRSATKNRRGGENPSAYACRDRRFAPRDRARCAAAPEKTHDVDARVWAKIATALESPEFAAKVEARNRARTANRRDWQVDVERYRTKLEQLARAEAGVAARYRKGLLSEEAFDLELAAAQLDRRRIESQLVAAEDAVRAYASAVPDVDVSAWVSQIRELARSTSPETRQRVVRAVVRGGAVFVDGQVIFDILVASPMPKKSGQGEPSGPARVLSPCSVSAETHDTETAVTIRVVA